MRLSYSVQQESVGVEKWALLQCATTVREELRNEALLQCARRVREEPRNEALLQCARRVREEPRNEALLQCARRFREELRNELKCAYIPGAVKASSREGKLLPSKLLWSLILGY